MDTTSRQPAGLPLCVDLDGTLLKSDLLYESVLALLRIQPLYALLLPWWLLRGRAAFKREVARRIELDPAMLPYDERVLELLRAHSGERVLCTAADEQLAQRVAAHLGLFDTVLASDGGTNLDGSRKARVLVERFGERGFDYAANARVDLHVWRVARNAWVVNAPGRIARSAARVSALAGHLPASGGTLRSWVKAIRVHQWLKNLLVFVPLLASHRFVEPVSAGFALAAFLAFSLCASAVYLLNDLLDLPADRQHPRKRNRPFAAGELSLLQGAMASALFGLAGLAIGLWCSPLFAGVLAVYGVTALAYSMYLKRKAMLDVVMLAGMYTLRIIGGAAAIGSGLSFWLLAFSMFVFLSLAMLKRYAELAGTFNESRAPTNGRGYVLDDLSLLRAQGVASGYVAVLVLAMYINSPESLSLYSRPQLLWLVCPLLLYWMSRMWVVAHRGLMDDDPVVFAARDRVSQCVILGGALIVLGAI